MKFTVSDYDGTITSTDGVWYNNMSNRWEESRGGFWNVYDTPISVLEMALRGVGTPDRRLSK